MDDEQLLFEKSGARATITFNRPAVHNAMTWTMYERLEAACDAIEADDEIRVVVLRGAGGKAFVAGTDIAQFRDFASGDDAVAYEQRIDRVVGRLESLARPTVAMLQGVCVGGGAALALACDFRYADDKLRLGIPIAKTLGNCLSTTNYARVIDLLGTPKAKEVLMLARLLKADECLAAGVVNDVFDADALEGEVDAIAERLTTMAPLTVTATKTAIRRIHEARRIAPEDGEDLIRACYTSEDFHGAVTAFLDKSAYSWQGR
ncbi:enoyl-CoA hydratase/isomerase family protein [Salinisphaera sp. T31B1]|uniref:enoyl-CoA hydratase/isomerase family protein n=1 Tax=Salinisphaera sp. T31B1 TaxID=727963 RepID=UPI00333E27F7